MDVISSKDIIRTFQAVNECLLNVNSTEPRTTCFTNDSVALSYGISVLMSIACFLLSVITSNDSWVDRFWSIIPVVCAWLHTVYPQGTFVTPQLLSTRLLFTLIITAWGVRLTYNFYRKGGYKKGGEDYRWNLVRTWPIVRHELVWPFFSFYIISVFQVILLVAIAIPVAQLPLTSPTGTDWLFAASQIIFLIFEAAADQQQWEFHQFKQGKREKIPMLFQADCERGFLTHGLFSFSRHPNVLCEQLFWLNVFFASTVYAGFSLSFIGSFVLVLLTNYSCYLTETISTSKYQTYRIYQKATPFIFPSPVSTRCEIDRKMALSDLVVRGKKYVN